MSTVKDLVDRLLRTYLEPPDYQPAVTHLDGAISAGASSLTLGTFVVPEDEELVRAGSILEIGEELFEVLTYDEFTQVCTVNTTAKFGTTTANHADGARIKLAPPFSRLSIREAIADNIITMYPSLWSVDTVNVAAVGNIAPLDDNLAVDVIEVWGVGGGGGIGARLVDFHPAVGTRAVILDEMIGDVWIKYRRRFGSVSAETDTLSDLGVDPRWERIVMVGACADLYVGRDLPSSHTSWVGQVLEAENVPIGTRTSIAGALGSYRDELLRAAMKEMRAEYRAVMRQNPIEIDYSGVW